MADIYHYFPVQAPISKVFQCISTPAGLNAWWTRSASGNPEAGNIYQLGFGEGYDWNAIVAVYKLNHEFELKMIEADDDWLNTRVGFLLGQQGHLTEVRFYHSGWSADHEHYRISNYCWAMYLRIMKRYLEQGEKVPYKHRLDV